MADNTQRNTTSGGDTIRDIDRSLNPVPIPAKTQVVQLDVGGENAENFVTLANPLPVYDTARIKAFLIMQQLQVVQVGSNGFVPIETPSFIAGL
jgi:hypothetical protein